MRTKETVSHKKNANDQGRQLLWIAVSHVGLVGNVVPSRQRGTQASPAVVRGSRESNGARVKSARCRTLEALQQGGYNEL